MVRQNPNQPDLFAQAVNQPVEKVEPLIDTSTIAAAADRRNIRYDPNARQSQAQIDLGGGIGEALSGEIDITHAVKIAKTRIRPTIPRTGLSSTGKLLADKEPDTKHDPAYQPPVFLTPEEKAEGLRQLQRIRRGEDV